MTQLAPEGDSLRKAIRWIDEAHRDNPEKKLLSLIDQAGMTFNLSPKDTDFLVRFYTKKD